MPKELQFDGFVGDDFSTDLVKNSLSALDGEDVTIFINSPGGFVFDGMEIYNIISRYPGKKTAVLGGLVASIATYITAAFDEVIATESSAFMIHNAEDWAVGDYKELKRIADRTEKANNQIAAILAERSGKTVDEIKSLMDETSWFYGQEIVDAGFADKLVKSKDTAQSRDIAIAQAQNLVKQSLAAVYKKKTEFNAGNGIENKTDREESMTKKEMLDKLIVMKESGELSLSEITDSFKIKDKLVTDEHVSALNTVNALREMNVTDPVKHIQNLQAQIDADADSVRIARLSEVFGVSNKDEKGEEKNLVLAYALDKAGKKSGQELVDVIEDLKKDPIAVQLQKEKADPHSATNRIGILEGNDNDKGKGKSGAKVIKL